MRERQNVCVRQNRDSERSGAKTDWQRDRGERRQCGEDLWVGPVCWLWAWSLCGPLLCNIHRSSGSHVSACGCNVHTCTHAHPYTHTKIVKTRMYACTYRLLAPEESSHCTITTLLCHWAVNICSRFCLISHLFLSVHLLIIPTVHLTLLGHITPQTRKSTTF